MRAILACLALAACAQPAAAPLPWWHAQPAGDRWATDRYECLREASIAVPPSQRLSSSGGYRAGDFWIPAQVHSRDESGPRRRQMVDLCLQARGWRQAATDPWAAQRRPEDGPLTRR